MQGENSITPICDSRSINLGSVSVMQFSLHLYLHLPPPPPDARGFRDHAGRFELRDPAMLA